MDWGNWPSKIGSEIEFGPEVYEMKIEREKIFCILYAGWPYRGNSDVLY